METAFGHSIRDPKATFMQMILCNLDILLLSALTIMFFWLFRLQLVIENIKPLFLTLLQ